MNDNPQPIPTTRAKTIQVNWFNECLMGVLISVAFTIMASTAGTSGVDNHGIAQRLYDLMVWGGLSMSVICGVAALAIIGYRICLAVLRVAIAFFNVGPNGQRVFGGLQAAKFLKIFLP